jgi:hypothetical protein
VLKFKTIIFITLIFNNFSPVQTQELLPQLPADLYQYKLFLLTNYATSQVISVEIQNLAYHQHKILCASKLFDTKLIAQNKLVQAELLKDRTHQEITITTTDNLKLTCSYFNRQKDCVIVVGPGHTNAKEKMALFAHMFPDFDILIINFRGLAYQERSFNPLYLTLEFTGDARFGQKEELDIQAAVQFLRQQVTLDNQPKYRQITGLGICLGAYIFTRAQGLAEQNNLKLFDQLILDGCWLSLESVIEKLVADPYLIINPQTGGASANTKQAIKLTHKLLLKIIKWKFELKLDGSSDLCQYFNSITIPTLFFYGKDDKLISRTNFETMWTALPTLTPKFAIITDKHHVHNHLTMPYFYKLACELFIYDYPSFAPKLTDLTGLINYLTQNLIIQAQLPIDQVFKPVKLT